MDVDIVIMIKVEQLSSCDGSSDVVVGPRARARKHELRDPAASEKLTEFLLVFYDCLSAAVSSLYPPPRLSGHYRTNRARAIDGPGRRCRVNDCANSSRAVRHRHLAFNIMVLYYFILCSYTPISRNNNIDFWNMLCAAPVVEYSARKHTLHTFALGT